mmetsp:Transcript_39062/g.59522  ORF Transcript_39062/g.59522 Transcript_39062/m.59522 type:complete len:213 (-) Transcript_39062:1421-2059(-)
MIVPMCSTTSVTLRYFLIFFDKCFAALDCCWLVSSCCLGLSKPFTSEIRCSTATVCWSKDLDSTRMKLVTCSGGTLHLTRDRHVDTSSSVRSKSAAFLMPSTLLTKLSIVRPFSKRDWDILRATSSLAWYSAMPSFTSSRNLVESIRKSSLMSRSERRSYPFAVKNFPKAAKIQMSSKWFLISKGTSFSKSTMSLLVVRPPLRPRRSSGLLL